MNDMSVNGELTEQTTRAGGPATGPAIEDFRCIATRGISDPLNAYPHSMKWHLDKLFVGKQVGADLRNPRQRRTGGDHIA